MRFTIFWAFVFFSVQAQAAPTLEERLYQAAIAQPRPWYPPGSDAIGAKETPVEYEQRIRMVVEALVAATSLKDSTRTIPVDWRHGHKALTAAVLTHWYEESKFAIEVHAGTKHPVWTQDDGKATCLGQLHRGLVPLRDWVTLAGTDEVATTRCARWTALTLTRMASYCGRKATRFEDIILPMFSGLSGSGCAPTLAARRKVERFAKIWRVMQHTREWRPVENTLLPAPVASSASLL